MLITIKTYPTHFNQNQFIFMLSLSRPIGVIYVRFGFNPIKSTIDIKSTFPIVSNSSKESKFKKSKTLGHLCIRPSPTFWGKLFQINFHEIDHIQLQLNIIQAYSIEQFHQIMLKSILPNFNPKKFHAQNGSRYHCWVSIKSQGSFISYETHMNTQKRMAKSFSH